MYAYFQGSHWHFIKEYIRLRQTTITQTINGPLTLLIWKMAKEASDRVMENEVVEQTNNR